MSHPPSLPSVGQVNLLQINLNHSKTSNDSAGSTFSKVILISHYYRMPTTPKIKIARTSQHHIQSFPTRQTVHTLSSGVELVCTRTGVHCAFITTDVKEGKTIIGYTYAASVDFEEFMEVWSHFIAKRHALICGGSFSVNYALWNCVPEDLRK